MILKIDGAPEKKSLSLNMITVENDNKVLSRKQICKLNVDNGWPEDTAWFPFICLFVTVYFQPLTFWCLKKNFLIDFEIWRQINCFFSGKENPRSPPFPHFPLYAALEHSAPTCCGKITIPNHFVKGTPRKILIWVHAHFYAFEAVVNK